MGGQEEQGTEVEWIWIGGKPRWDEEAVIAVGGADNILSAWGSDDYQGSGVILTRDHKVLSWNFGSCNGCDGFEDLAYDGSGIHPAPKVVAALRDDVVEYTTAALALAAFSEAPRW